MQGNVRWCCAPGESSDRSVECDSTGDVVQLGLKVSPTRSRRRWTIEVPDTIDSINKEAKCPRKTKEKLRGARKALESSTLKAAVAVAEFAFASPREPPDKMSPGQDALGNAKESKSDLDTRVLEREAMPSRVSKYGVVAVTGRFATRWSTRAQ